METPQGNSLYSYLYLKQTKLPFYLFSSAKENRKAEEFLHRGEIWYPVGEGKWSGKGIGG
jgi:hypothetical protein